jgi:hypothetical protein
MIKLYISKLHNKLYGKPFNVETLDCGICLNPKYRISEITCETNIIIDSGAYQDKTERVTYDVALDRQLDYATKLKLETASIAAYDTMKNCKATVEANKYLSSKCHEFNYEPIYILQGPEYSDFEYCYQETNASTNNISTIGIGGISRIGISSKMQSTVYSFLESYLPIFENNNIHTVHFFGVGSLKIIRSLYDIFRDYNIDISCDTSSYEQKGIFGYKLNTITLRYDHLYTKEDKYINYDPYMMAFYNINCAINYVNNLNRGVYD